MSQGQMRRTAGGMIPILVSFVAACAAQETRAPVVTASDGPEDVPTAASAPLDPRIDQILTRLEERKVDDLIAALTHTTTYVTDVEEADTKTGTIHYKALKPVAKFAIHFTQKTDDRNRPIDETHIFDGCWYIEVQPKTKTVNRYEVRKPNDPVDPYKVKEGIFPLPFGQKKSEMLAEFEMARRDPATGDPPQTDHLVLTPRPGTRLEQRYKTLDIWVAQSGAVAGLPIQVKAAKKNGNGKLDQYITIRFSDVKLNTGFSGTAFEFVPPANYTREDHPLNAPVPGADQQP